MFIKAMICLILATTGCNYLFQNQQIQMDLAQHQNPVCKELRNNINCNMAKNHYWCYDSIIHDYVPCEYEIWLNNNK